MIEQNLNRFLIAYAKAPKRSVATLYIVDNYYHVQIKNGHMSSLDIKLGYTSKKSEIGYKIPKIKVTKKSHCELSLDDVGCMITVKAGGTTTIIRLETCGKPTEKLINTTEPETILNSSEFFNRAAQVAIAASNDDTKPTLRCISVNYNLKGDYSMAATDGHRLAYMPRLPEYDDYGVLFLAEDLKMLSLLASGALLLKGKNISIGDDVLYCCHTDGSYPDYEFLTRPGNTVINLGDTKGLIKKVKKLNKKSIVDITMTEETLNFSTDDSFFGHKANNEGLHIDQTIRLNRNYLIDALTNCCGYFYYDDVESPLIFVGVDSNHLVMTVRPRI